MWRDSGKCGVSDCWYPLVASVVPVRIFGRLLRKECLIEMHGCQVHNVPSEITCVWDFRVLCTHVHMGEWVGARMPQGHI